MSAAIKNVVARVWTKAELRQTVSECKANGFTVTKNKNFEGHVLIIDEANNEVVLEGAPGFGKSMVIRINTSYFNN